MKCRFCNHQLTHEFIDLVNSPPSNSFLTIEQLNQPEVFYPLKLFICDNCFLVQIDEYKKSDDIFNKEYAYFSSYSISWLEHARTYVEMIIKRNGLNKNSYVIEIASNDGYLLQHFKGIPCMGIEPSANTAKAARKKGVETLEKFFNTDLANWLVQKNMQADLIVGNNVLAHVPDINDFVNGLKIALKRSGTITMEFPHLMRLIEGDQFDTIYHEHFSYFSFYTVGRIFKEHGLRIYDVEELPTHGGSLRIYACHRDNTLKTTQPNVEILTEKEFEKGLTSMAYYNNFQNRVNEIKYNFIKFLLEQKEKNKVVIAYGAAAKGNTLLNYCGIKNDLIAFVADVTPYKQGKFLPGSHIPVVGEERIKKDRPDLILILPWNVKDEIMERLSYIHSWGGRFVFATPNYVYREII